MPELRTVVVATKHKGAEAVKALAALKKHATIHVRHEDDNPFDPNAVACYADGVHIGYVPRTHNSEIARLLRSNVGVMAELAAEAIVDNGDIKAVPRVLLRWNDTSQGE